MRKLLTAAATTLVAATTVIGLAATASNAATVAPIGKASAVKATVFGVGIQPTPSVQGTAANNYTESDEVFSFKPAVLGSSLSFGVLSADTLGDASTGGVTSTGGLQDAQLTVGTPPFGIPQVFSFGVDSLQATCTSTPTSFTGSSTLVGGSLSVFGYGVIDVPVNPPANFGVDLGPIGKVVFNEQVKNADGSITVNAFHIQIATSLGADFVLGSATCGPTTGEKPVEVPNHTAVVAAGSTGAAAAGALAFVAVRRRRDEADLTA